MRRKVNEIADHPVSENQLPVPQVDRLLHEPARFTIAAHLYLTESADFLLLFRQTELTWGNLFSHVRKLETAGYVTVQKGPAANGSRTAVRLTDQGRSAFEHYCQDMGRCLEQVSVKGDGDSAPKARLLRVSPRPALFLKVAQRRHPGLTRPPAF